MADQEILFEKRGKTCFITFNRPKRKNAIRVSSYGRIDDIIRKANDDPDTVFTVFTGAGDFFSSGNDFSPESMMERGKGYETMIDALIDHKKILIAFINGPAIGVACTMLSLFDYTVASEKAYFYCPFTVFGLVPEGTSSYSFEAIMGYPKAARLGVFGDRMTAKEAFESGYISKVVPDAEFARTTQEILKDFETRLSPHSLIATKEIMRGPEWRQKMHRINHEEKEKIEELMFSEDTLERIMKRFGSKL